MRPSACAVRRVGHSMVRAARLPLGGSKRHIYSRPESALTEPYTVHVVGAPMCYGQPLAGVEKGPTEIRKANLRLSVTALGWRWADQGDVLIPKPRSSDPKPPFGGKNMYAVGVANNNIHKATAAAAAEGDFVLTLGGDHSIAMGSIAGVLTARPELAVVWVDAHADINLPDTSPSGNVHGMPLSFLLRLVDPSLVPGCEWLAGTPPLTTSRLVYVGLRDLDTGEKKAIRSAGIRAFTMQDVDKHGIGKVMEMALDHVAGKGARRPLHLSYDIDAVDPAVAPSTGTAVNGGLNYREAHYVAEALAETGMLGSMDLVEINPDLVPGVGGMATVTLGVELVGSALGKNILPPETPPE